MALRHPRGETDLNEEMLQTLVYELADDFGLSRLVLSWTRKRSSGDEDKTGSEAIASWRGRDRPAHVLEQFNWDMSQLGLLPEDEVLYRLTVYDNDAVSGPKAASTAEYKIRFPSLEEIFDREQQRQEQISTDLQDLERRGEQLHEQVKKLNETIERGQQLQWEDNQQINQAVQEQQKMLEEVRKLAQSLEESIEQMQRGEMMSNELLDKMSKVQELMDQVATERLRQLMEKIQQSIEKMDRAALEEAMEQLQVSQEEILQKLDKTLALLERIKLEQQLDDLVQMTEELAETASMLADSTGTMLSPRQRADADSIARSMAGLTADADSVSSAAASADSSSGGGDNPMQQQSAADESGNMPSAQETPDTESPGMQEQASQAQEQQQATDSAPTPENGEKMRQLEEETSEMGEQTNELFEMIAEAAIELARANEQETAANMMSESTSGRRTPVRQFLEQATQGYQQGKPQQSFQAQRGMENEMREMNQRMQQYRQDIQQQWRQQVAEAMKRAFDQLNFLSENQEALIAEVDREPDFNHPDILGYAAREQEIVQGIESVRKEIVEAAKDNFFISGQLLEILYLATSQAEHSTGQLEAENRRKQSAMSSLERSMTVINAGMLTLLRDSQNMQQSTSGTGMDQMLMQMEEMAQRQQRLNQMSQDALNQQQGEGQNSMPGPGTTPRGQGQSSEGLMEMLRRMAAEQEAIRRQLQDMAQQARGRSDMMGNALEGAAREAEEVVKELQERGISQETLERQNRIFNRLMDAQKSVQERESGRRRQAERPEDFTITRPDDLPEGVLDPGDGAGRLDRQLERWQGSYPESYRALIRRYYELLRTRELEQ